MKTVTLRNGSQEADVLVNSTFMVLKHMFESGIPGMLLASDLLQICAGCPDYEPSTTAIEELKERSLLQQDGRPHTSIKNVVLSSFEGTGLDAVLVSPLSE